MDKIPWYQSKVLIGLAVAFVAFVLDALGVTQDVNAEAQRIVDLLVQLLEAGGMLYAGYARVTKPTPPVSEIAVEKRDARVAVEQGPPPVSPPKQAGFARVRLLLLISALAVAVPVVATLPACAELGVPKAQTIPDRLAAAELSVNGSTASVAKLLNGGVITAKDGKAFRELVVNAHELLGAAETAFEAGDISQAEDRLAVAESVLKSVRAFVVAREGGGS